MGNILINPRGTILKRTRQFIAYADGVAIICRSAGALNEVLRQLQTAALSTGFVINTDKTKHMKTREAVNVANMDIELNGHNFERVDTFIYLDSIITSQNEIKYDLKDKISAANRCFHALNKVLSKRYVRRSTKIKTQNSRKTDYIIQL
jgi:hypothetical protein